MADIHATPGWAASDWPRSMTLEENRGDLVRHAADFAAGCLYIYPAKEGEGAIVRSWVWAADAALDRPLYQAVSVWIAREWPFDRVVYAPR